MMTRNMGMQHKIIRKTIDELVPETHFLRKLDEIIDFNFIYDVVEKLYSSHGRPSIDPVVIIKILLLGYLYGIDSERKLVEVISDSISFRWFLGYDIDDAIPDHSTLSQLRRRKFKDKEVFEELFDKIVFKCIEEGFVDGKLLLTDSTHIRARADNSLYEKIEVTVEPSKYVQRLNEIAIEEKITTDTKVKSTQNIVTKSTTDSDSGMLNRPGKPKGFHYLNHQTCDAKNGIITDVCVTAGNVCDNTVHSDVIKKQIEKYDFQLEAVCADKGYDSSEIHFDMLELNVQTFIPKKVHCNENYDFFTVNDFKYNKENDTFICQNDCELKFSTFRKKDGSKRYRCDVNSCSNCILKEKCISGKAKCKEKEVERAFHKTQYEEQHSKSDGTAEYYEAMRLRKVFAECNFANQKANHNLKKVNKFGLDNAFEHCLLSACACNIKRLIKLKIS